MNQTKTKAVCNNICGILKKIANVTKDKTHSIDSLVPVYFTCLLRNLHAGPKATVRTEHGTMDWFQIGKGVHQGCILSPCLFYLNAEYIMWNARLNEAQAGIKTVGRNSSNLGFPGGSEVKAFARNGGDPGSIPGSGRSPGEGNGNPLQYSCLENPMEGGAW